MISIRRLFLRDLLGLFGLLAALSVGLAAWGIHRTLNQQIAARADEHLDRVQRDLANHLAEAANLGTSLGHAWQEGMLSLERPERLAKAEPELRLLLEAVPSVVTVCIYDTAGRGLVLSHHREGFRTLFITQGAPAFQGRVLRERGIPQDRPYLPKAPYDPTTRPWFVAARESSGPRWIPPYAFQNADNQGLTYVVPLRDAEGRFRGVVSIDQSLGELSDRIWRARPTPGTRTLVCDEAGRTLIVPRDEPPPPNGLRFLRRLGPDFLPAFAALQARWARVSHPKEFLHFSHGGERWPAMCTRSPPGARPGT